MRKKYGLLPPKKAESDTVCLVHGLCGNTLCSTLLALKIIDPVINTGWLEIVEAKHKSATSIQDLFHYTWLVRYRQPQLVVFDNETDGEFKREIKQMITCDNYGIKAKPITSHNQQYTTTVHKQMQSLSENTKMLSVNDILRSFDSKIIMKI
jgi:hypothetical protein